MYKLYTAAALSSQWQLQQQYLLQCLLPVLLKPRYASTSDYHLKFFLKFLQQRWRVRTNSQMGQFCTLRCTNNQVKMTKNRNISTQIDPNRSSRRSSKSPCTLNAIVNTSDTTGDPRHPWHAWRLAIGKETLDNFDEIRKVFMKIMWNFKVQTKAALKGWSALTGDKTGSTPQSAGPKKVNIIFVLKNTLEN